MISIISEEQRVRKSTFNCSTSYIIEVQFDGKLYAINYVLQI